MIRALAALLLCWATLGGAAWAPGAWAATAPLAGLEPVEAKPQPSGLPAGWDRRGVFMEIFVRGFQDSDGDGIGDLNGVTRRLDELHALGITGLWLMPIFKSADHDHGYAVVDYREIEPAYGSLADLDRLLAEAHRRGIGVIVDYVMNHSSSEHPLFKSARGDPGSPYAGWYVFSDTPQKGWTTFGGNPWHAAGARWYYGAFTGEMPDFNLRNPAVVDFHLDNLRFWLNRGVDGFRFDAVGVLVENGSLAWENQPENHGLMARIQALMATYGGRTMICEAPSAAVEFSAESSCGSAFAFGLQKQMIRSAKLGRVMPEVIDALGKWPIGRMGTFLANHDFFAGARLARQFGDDDKSYRLAAATLLTLPGKPFLYYGEEIGMAQAEGVMASDPSLRGPMSWSAEPNAGFTTAARPFRPNAGNWRTHNLAAEQADPKSLWQWYRALIALRTSKPALATGSLTLLSKEDDPVFAFLREQDGQRVLVAINYAAREVTHALPSGFDLGAWKAVFPAATAAATAPASAPANALRVGPQQVLIFEEAAK